jgi:glycine cleavage system H lipoate-binding protein
MSAIVGALQVVGAFLVGMVARFGIVLLVMAALLVPVALALGAARGIAWARRRLSGLKNAGGALFRQDVRYAKGHTWAAREGSALTVGVDGLVQKMLPWAVGVTLPKAGTVVKEGEVIATVSAGGGELRITAPVSGRVLAANVAAAREPSLVKDEGYGRGWLFSIEPVDARFATLLAGQAAREWLAAESHRFDRFVETRLGVAHADGGAFVAPPAALLDGHQWEEVNRAFLTGV